MEEEWRALLKRAWRFTHPGAQALEVTTTLYAISERGHGSEGKWECSGWAKKGHLRERPQQLTELK